MHAHMSIMQKWGLLRFWGRVNALPAAEWKAYIWQNYERMVEYDDDAQITEKSSLALYQSIRPEQGELAPCLDDRSNRVASTIQTQLRLGVAPLAGRLIRLLGGSPSAALCPVCRKAAPEDEHHLLWGCPMFSEDRATMKAMVEQVLRQAGQAGQQARKLLQDHTKLQQVILGTPLPITVPPGSKRDQAEFKKNGAKLLWALDKIAKNFLLVVWKRRTAIAGTFSIENGALTANPPDAKHRRWLCNNRSRRPLTPSLNIHSRQLQQFWSPWLRYFKKCNDRSYEKKCRKNFYRVWCGRRVGLFYKWSDCLESIRGYPSPKFKGFMSWDKAVNSGPIEDEDDNN